MRITIDLDAQTGQPQVSTSSPAAALTGGGLNGGAATVTGVAIGAGLNANTLSGPPLNGGASGGGDSGGAGSTAEVNDAGPAPR